MNSSSGTHHKDDLIDDSLPSLPSLSNKSILEFLNSFIRQYKRSAHNDCANKFMLEFRDYLMYLRGDDILSLNGFVHEWIAERIEILRVIIHSSSEFRTQFRQIHSIFTNSDVVKEVTSNPTLPSLTTNKFNTTQAELEKGSIMMFYLICTCLSWDCHHLCQGFIVRLMMTRESWLLLDHEADDHVWRILRFFFLVTRHCCNNILTSIQQSGNDLNSLQYIIMPVVVSTVIIKLDQLTGLPEINEQVDEMHSILDQIVSHPPLVHKSSANLMCKIRVLINSKASDEIQDQFNKLGNKVLPPNPIKKPKILIGPGNTNHFPLDIPTPHSGDILYSGKIVPQPGDGHCLFHSIIYSTSHKISTVEQALQLRRELAQYMAANRTTILPGGISLEETILTDSDVARHSIGENGQPCFNTYLMSLCDGTKIYGGVVEIDCLSKMLNTSIVVFQRVQIDGKLYFASNENRNHRIEESTREIGLLFQKPHYEVLENYYAVTTYCK